MSEDTYFVIDVSADGAYLRPYTKEKLLKKLDEGEFDTSEVITEIIDGGFTSWDLAAEAGLLIIKGKIVVPGEEETVTKHTLE